MAKTDIARRVYNHAWKLDPIVRSLLDTDFYKLLMLQMIWGMYPKVNATFSLINRTTSVRLAEDIDEGELREQLDHARTLRFGKKEMIWLGGNTFYGRKQIFEPEFLAWLENFRLPEYTWKGAAASTNWSSTGRGCTPPCGKSRRWRSSTNCARAQPCAISAHSSSTCFMRVPRQRSGTRPSACASCPISASRTSARAAATVFCGSAGAWKR